MNMERYLLWNERRYWHKHVVEPLLIYERASTISNKKEEDIWNKQINRDSSFVPPQNEYLDGQIKNDAALKAIGNTHDSHMKVLYWETRAVEVKARNWKCYMCDYF